MRDYGKVHTSFWSSDTLRGLDDDAKFLALYLMTCPHTNLAGVFRLPMAYAAEDTGWTTERLGKGFETLSDAGWLVRDAASGWVWIVKWLKWNKPDNENMWKAVRKMVAQVPDSVSFKASVDALMSPRETVSEPFPNLPSPSPSPSAVASKKAMPEIPLDDGSDFAVPDELAAELKSAYPKVDLPAELAKVRAWCVANPAQRKTRRGVGRFLNSWIGRAAKEQAANFVPEPTRKHKEL